MSTVQTVSNSVVKLAMLTIDMKSFRHHKALTVTLKEGVTHIKGKNGVGKSTIAAAIRWALYGTLRNTAPTSAPGAKTRVMLTYEAEGVSVSITRSKGNRLTCREVVNGIETIHDGIAAQAVINGRFGSEMEWMSNYYIPQQRSHILIGASTSDCLSLFHSLKYRGETPDNVSSIIDTLRNSLTTACRDRDLLLSRVGDSTYIDHVCPTIEKPDVETRTWTLSATVGRLSTVTSSLIEKRQQEGVLSGILSLPDLDIASLRREEEVAKKCIETTARRIAIESELSSIVVPVIYTRSELVTMKKTYEVYQKGLDTTDKYGLEYSAEALKKRQEELNTSISAATAAKDRQERRARLLSEAASVASSSEEELTTINQRICQAKIRYEELKSNMATPEGVPCPHCDELVTISSGKLIKGGERTETLSKMKKEYSSIAASLDKDNKSATSLIRSLTLKKATEQELSTLTEEVVIDNTTLSAWKLELSDLNLVTIVEKPQLSLNDISSSIRRIDLREELKSLPSTGRSVIEIQSDIVKAEKRQQLRRQLPSSIQVTESTLSSLMGEIRLLEKEKTNLLLKQSMEEAILESEKKMVAEWTKHTLCPTHREIKECRRKINNLTKAIDIANRTYQEGLEETISTVNTLLAEVCSRLYEKNLVLRFVLIKSGEEIDRRVRRKSSISLMASIDGDERCISDVSGGEFSRASLSLLLVMAIHTSPLFLILDEPFSGIPEDLQDVFMELLKQYLPTTPTLLILHGNVGSSIDHSLHLTESGLH